MKKTASQTTISPNKFHRLYGKDLSVALESTFDAKTGIVGLRELEKSYPYLVYRSPESKVIRVYCMAISNADMSRKKRGKIIFEPRVDETHVQFHRLCLRARPMKSNQFQWIRFGRFGEDRDFGFFRANPFISLDFFSKRGNEFLPLYVKIQEANKFVYFRIRAEISDEKVALIVSRIDRKMAPAHLISARP